MRFLIALALLSCQVEHKKGAAQADCAKVAETLASFELGSTPAGAPVEKRTPLVTKYRQACTTAHATQAEADCLAKARDTWAARTCVPSMFPPTGGAGDCAKAMAKMREAFVAAIGSAPGGPDTTQLDKMLPVMQLSCEQDKWPAAITSCLASIPAADMQAVQNCMQQLPPELNQRMQTRMQARAQQK